MENFSVLALFHENASINVVAGNKNSPAAPQYMSLDLTVLPVEETSSSILEGNLHRLRLFLYSRPLSRPSNRTQKAHQIEFIFTRQFRLQSSWLRVDRFADQQGINDRTA